FQIRDALGNVMYGLELLSGSRREAGGLTHSVLLLYVTQEFMCAEQREENQPIRHSTALHRLYGSLVRRYRKELMYISSSLSDHLILKEECGNTHTVERCQIVHQLQDLYATSAPSTHPTLEFTGVSLNLEEEVILSTSQCTPSILTADFYRDGSLLQTQTTGEMIIHTVSKSDEGLYHCKHPEKGVSPKSWLSVRGSSSSGAPVSVLSVLSSLMAVSPYLLVSIVHGGEMVRKVFRWRRDGQLSRRRDRQLSRRRDRQLSRRRDRQLSRRRDRGLDKRRLDKRRLDKRRLDRRLDKRRLDRRLDKRRLDRRLDKRRLDRRLDKRRLDRDKR
ncbi:hypothetical protein NFI96_013002, partial [Prochilodus magdalenae]